MKSSLSTKEILTNNYNTRKKPITKFTPHHTAVVGAAAETIASNFSKNGNSANYVIGSDGTIISCVPEEYRPWTSGSEDNDTQAITVEVCNSGGEPDWKVSDKALEALINLGVDICRRYNLPAFTWTGNKNGTLTIHKMFQATACPGPYLESKMPYIAEQIAKRLNTQAVNDVWYKVQVGAFKNKSSADKLLAELKSKGYDGFIVTVGQSTSPTTTTTATPPTIAVGSKVRVKVGAKTYDGASLATYVYTRTHTVKEIKGNRAVITFEGVVVAAININDLVLI